MVAAVILLGAKMWKAPAIVLAALLFGAWINHGSGSGSITLLVTDTTSNNLLVTDTTSNNPLTE